MRITRNPKPEKKNLAFQGTPVKTPAHRTAADIAKRITSNPKPKKNKLPYKVPP